jgi:hypothetical protein
LGDSCHSRDVIPTFQPVESRSSASHLIILLPLWSEYQSSFFTRPRHILGNGSNVGLLHEFESLVFLYDEFPFIEGQRHVYNEALHCSLVFNSSQ